MQLSYLDGDEPLGQPDGGGDEDGGHLADVGGDHVADERLHVVVDGAALLHRCHDGRKVVVRKHLPETD
eukprot:7552764-Pyramimonas_sp.AAC.2